MSSEDEEALEVWLDGLTIRAVDPCNTSWNHAALPELCRLLWRPVVAWPLLECAVDAAAALVAQASGSPSLGREGRAERLALLSTTSLVPALVGVLGREGSSCPLERQGCYRGSLAALKTLLGSVAAEEAAELGRLLPLRSHEDLLPMAAGCLRGLCAHKEARAALLASAGTASLLRRCLRGGPDTQPHALAASCMLRLHELSSLPLDTPIVLPTAEDSQALWRLLLSPLGPERFSSYWEQRPLSLPLPPGSDGEARLGLFGELLCSLHRVGRSELPHLPPLPPPPPAAMLDSSSHAVWLIESMVDGGGLEVLSGAGRLGGDIDLVRSADAVRAERVTRLAQRHLPTAAQAAQGGFTRIVPRMQWRCAATARLVGALQRAMGAPLSANLYETPAGGRGLEAHYDDHCVLVLQLAGSKTWRLSGPAPAERLPPLRSPRTAAPPASNCETEVMLARGDALYVPRGVQHSCVAGSEGSTHLTLGIEVEPVLEWHALLQLLLLSAPRAVSDSVATAPACAATCLLQSVSLPRVALLPACERKRRFENLTPPAATSIRWLELIQMALLLGRDGEPDLRAIAPLPTAADTAAVTRHARCLLLRVGGGRWACGAWRLLDRRGGQEEAEGLRRLAPLLASFKAAGIASPCGGAAAANFVGETQAPPSETAVLEMMEQIAESLDDARVEAACLLQQRMLQQLLEARAVATEAFLTASGDLHHAWQGRGG